jgi:hypothetical protein
MYPVPWRYHFRFVIFNFSVLLFKLNYSKFKTSTKYDLYVTYIHRSHQIIKPSTMTTTSDIVQDVLNLLGSGDVSEETRVRLRTFLSTNAATATSTIYAWVLWFYTYTSMLQRDDFARFAVREGGCGLTSRRLWTIYIATWRPPRNIQILR